MIFVVKAYNKVKITVNWLLYTKGLFILNLLANYPLIMLTIKKPKKIKQICKELASSPTSHSFFKRWIIIVKTKTYAPSVKPKVAITR